MFGKTEWFRPKTRRWGLTPITWQGWAYTLAWSLVMVVPFVALLWRLLLPEAMVWIAVTSGLLLWDVRRIRKHLLRPDDDILEILDEVAPRSPSLTTRRYRMHERG